MRPAPAEIGQDVPSADSRRAAKTLAFDSDDFLERLVGDRKLARRLVRRFIDDMPGQIALPANAVNSSDSKDVRFVARSLRVWPRM